MYSYLHFYLNCKNHFHFFPTKSHFLRSIQSSGKIFSTPKALLVLLGWYQNSQKNSQIPKFLFENPDRLKQLRSSRYISVYIITSFSFHAFSKQFCFTHSKTLTEFSNKIYRGFKRKVNLVCG